MKILNVPKEVATCPECGGEVRYMRSQVVTFGFCAGDHFPKQSEAMFKKWEEVDRTVEAWLKTRSEVKV